jgi:lipopolysaccharide export LptBFGC system permease protein LptF
MTKNSELLVMKACGISLYRAAMPVLLFGFLASGALFLLQERVLAHTSREANRLERVIRNWPARKSPLDRHWRVGANGDIYHYDGFDPARNRFARLSLYGVDAQGWRLRRMTHVADAYFAPEHAAAAGRRDLWLGSRGWTRELPAKQEEGQGASNYTVVDEIVLQLGEPADFTSDIPAPDEMALPELLEYIQRLRASGADPVPATVTLHRKIAFPLATIVVTLLAVPFAVTTGRRGALYGIGVGIVCAITYMVMMNVFFALGTGGVLPPVLAAWAPNLLFGAGAAYLILTVRT